MGTESGHIEENNGEVGTKWGHRTSAESCHNHANRAIPGVTEVLKNERADYGKQICSTLPNKLTAECGDGFEMIDEGKVAR